MTEDPKPTDIPSRAERSASHTDDLVTQLAKMPEELLLGLKSRSQVWWVQLHTAGNEVRTEIKQAEVMHFSPAKNRLGVRASVRLADGSIIEVLVIDLFVSKTLAKQAAKHRARRRHVRIVKEALNHKRLAEP